ncbi:hypothetical protein GLAREA_12800 [Glarea lozoyensis ATCC 20868]|nr:uncharacterized protein GLAREA_12800 [Glarea lozoyensis ATCC 20868]EPE30077.1 hypothetical protein GLAREA_12800 [Glarea lozoyensis ATCC 20868]
MRGYDEGQAYEEDTSQLAEHGSCDCGASRSFDTENDISEYHARREPIEGLNHLSYLSALKYWIYTVYSGENVDPSNTFNQLHESLKFISTIDPSSLREEGHGSWSPPSPLSVLPLNQQERDMIDWAASMLHGYDHATPGFERVLEILLRGQNGRRTHEESGVFVRFLASGDAISPEAREFLEGVDVKVWIGKEVGELMRQDEGSRRRTEKVLSMLREYEEGRERRRAEDESSAKRDIEEVSDKQPESSKPLIHLPVTISDMPFKLLLSPEEKLRLAKALVAEGFTSLTGEVKAVRLLLTWAQQVSERRDWPTNAQEIHSVALAKGLLRSSIPTRRAIAGELQMWVYHTRKEIAETSKSKSKSEVRETVTAERQSVHLPIAASPEYVIPKSTPEEDVELAKYLVKEGFTGKNMENCVPEHREERPLLLWATRALGAVWCHDGSDQAKNSEALATKIIGNSIEGNDENAEIRRKLKEWIEKTLLAAPESATVPEENEVGVAWEEDEDADVIIRERRCKAGFIQERVPFTDIFAAHIAWLQKERPRWKADSNSPNQQSERNSKKPIRDAECARSILFNVPDYRCRGFPAYMRHSMVARQILSKEESVPVRQKEEYLKKWIRRILRDDELIERSELFHEDVLRHACRMLNRRGGFDWGQDVLTAVGHYVTYARDDRGFEVWGEEFNFDSSDPDQVEWELQQEQGFGLKSQRFIEHVEKANEDPRVKVRRNLLPTWNPKTMRWGFVDETPVSYSYWLAVESWDRKGDQPDPADYPTEKRHSEQGRPEASNSFPTFLPLTTDPKDTSTLSEDELDELAKTLLKQGFTDHTGEEKAAAKILEWARQVTGRGEWPADNREKDGVVMGWKFLHGDWSKLEDRIKAARLIGEFVEDRLGSEVVKKAVETRSAASPNTVTSTNDNEIRVEVNEVASPISETTETAPQTKTPTEDAPWARKTLSSAPNLNSLSDLKQAIKDIIRARDILMKELDIPFKRAENAQSKEGRVSAEALERFSAWLKEVTNDKKLIESSYVVEEILREFSSSEVGLGNLKALMENPMAIFGGFSHEGDGNAESTDFEATAPQSENAPRKSIYTMDVSGEPFRGSGSSAEELLGYEDEEDDDTETASQVTPDEDTDMEGDGNSYVGFGTQAESAKEWLDKEGMLAEDWESTFKDPITRKIAGELEAKYAGADESNEAAREA